MTGRLTLHRSLSAVNCIEKHVGLSLQQIYFSEYNVPSSSSQLANLNHLWVPRPFGGQNTRAPIAWARE